MAVELAAAYVSIVPSARGIGQGIAAELGGPLDAAGGKAGTSSAKRFGVMFAAGMKLAALGGVAVLGGAFAAFQIGSQFDDAFDTIRTQTGETGAVLEGLKDDFRAVVGTVPTDFATAGDAIAGLNQRLGLTGKPLQDISAQLLNLSRITETDLATNIETSTRLMGDWGVEQKDIPGALDRIFRASQATGPSVDRLGQMMVQFGAPMRQLGFDFNTTAALLGKFEKEGVNTEVVMGSMRIALGKMAKDGEAPVATLNRVMDSIKGAGSAGEANAIALELFGAKAGPDMAAAIREGRFEVDDLVSTIAGGSDTINGAASDTADFSEKWTLFKNRVLLALEPIAMRVFDGMAAAMDELGPKVEQLAAWGRDDLLPALRDLGDWMERNKPIMIAVGAAIGTVLVGAFLSWAAAAAAAAFATFMAMAPLLLLGLVIGAVVLLAILWWQQFGDRMKLGAQRIKDAIADMVERVKEKWNQFKAAFESTKDQIGRTVDRLASFFTSLPGRISSAASGMWDGIKEAFRSVLNWIIRAWNGLQFTIPGFDPPGPGPAFGGFTLGLPQLQEFHDGGLIPGTREIPIMALGGERVLNRAQARDWEQGGNGGGRALEVVTKIDGREVARASYPHIRVMERGKS